MQTMAREIGKRIKALRESLGMDQKEAAKWLGISTSGYQAREQGKVFFPIPDLIIYSEKCGVSLDYLLTGKTSIQNLMEEEERLLKSWRLIDDADKRFILSVINDALTEKLIKR